MQLINKVILGTVQFGLPYGINNTAGMPSDEHVERILDTAYDAGIRTLDTAEGYGNAIERIGLYHERHNHSFSVINKFKEIPTASSVGAHVNKSAQILRIPVVDTYLFHSYGDYVANSELIKSMVSLKDKGQIRSIGVSIYTNEQFDHVINDELISVIQFPYNVLDNDRQRLALMEKAKTKRKTLHTRSVFLQGLFFKDFGNFPTNLKPLIPYIEQVKEIAGQENMDVTTLTLNYALSNPLIDGVLIGVESVNQLRKNIEVIDPDFATSIREKVNEIVVKEIELLNPANWN